MNVIETKDGVPIKLFATVKNKSNAIYANQVGIKSAGLISTEFFQPIDSFENGMQSLRDICEYFNVGVSAIRLFDYDQNKSYFFENNKFERGIRAYESKKVRQIIDAQLKGCVYLSKNYSIEIVIQFVTNIQDIITIKNKLKEYDSNIPVCVMIENPASYLSVKEFAEYVNSFSIGTNDLLQYFFACDRDSISKEINYINPYSKALIDFWQLYPSNLLNKTRICGQLPIYPYMLQTLIQLGFKNFSIPSPMIPFVAKKIKNISLCQEFIAHLKTLTNDDEVRNYIIATMLK